MQEIGSTARASRYAIGNRNLLHGATAMELTLEQAIEYATGYEMQMEEAREMMNKSRRDSSLMHKAIRKYNDAKIMLEWYHGYDTTDSLGNRVHINGTIQKLAGEAQRLKESSNLGARFENRTFGNFEVRKNPTAYNSCVSYSNREDLFSANRNSLLIFGGYGTGKTHLAAAIANALIDRGIPVLFGTFADHLEKIREEFDKTGQRRYQSLMKNTSMLVLDDVGKERLTDWAKEILFNVINYRYEHKLPFVLTTNYSENQLGNYIGGAVYSRMC